MNLKHLYYFWKVAKHGGVMRAGEAIHISPQTLSGQIKLLEARLGMALFQRHGRHLELTEAGKVAFEYAEELFALSAELDQVMKNFPAGRPTEFRVGVSDALPKSLAYRLLRPAIMQPKPVRIICREWRLDRLLAELAMHRLELVLCDTPVPAHVDVRVYSHKLGESGVAFLAHAELAKKAKAPFPACLAHMPMLLPGEDSSLRRAVTEWLGKQKLPITIAGEFDDAALMAAFGRERVGVFPVLGELVAEYTGTGDLVVLGEAEQVSIRYYALSARRRSTHPCVLAITAPFETFAEESWRRVRRSRT